MRRTAVIAAVILLLALVLRAGVAMSLHSAPMDGMGGDCAGICAAGHEASAQTDCLDHCLAAGTLHPVEAMGVTLLALLAVTAFLTAKTVSDELDASDPRRRRSGYGRRLALESVATDVLRE